MDTERDRGGEKTRERQREEDKEMEDQLQQRGVGEAECTHTHSIAYRPGNAPRPRRCRSPVRQSYQCAGVILLACRCTGSGECFVATSTAAGRFPLGIFQTS